MCVTWNSTTLKGCELKFILFSNAARFLTVSWHAACGSVDTMELANRSMRNLGASASKRNFSLGGPNVDSTDMSILAVLRQGGREPSEAG